MSLHKSHQEGQYVICGGADQHWRGTTAKTERGAKMLASRAYPVGGKIEVAQVRDDYYVVIARKYGYDQWVAEW